MKIKIGEKGLINKGDMKGWYTRVDDDYKNTGGFLIIYNLSSDMSSGVGYDNWVENEASLKELFEENSWTINWAED